MLAGGAAGTELSEVIGKSNAAADAEELAPGVQVFLTGLESASFLNAAFGTCQEWDGGKGRWKVRLANGQERNVKSENLAPMGSVLKRRGAPVFIKGLATAANLNGTIGSCMHFNAEAGRWVVHCDTGEEKSIKVENLTPLAIALQPGSLAFLRKLQSAAHLNGRQRQDRQVRTCRRRSGGSAAPRW